MKFVDEYRSPDAVHRLAEAVRARATGRWTLMEVCGGQTHTILAYGLDELLGESVELLHGPGCPVCVTPVEVLDRAIAMACRPGTIVCSFGDMLRVPGSERDLLDARASGGDVRVVYSPLDAAKLAAREPARDVVFLAVGFETTVPAVAGAVRWAREQDLRNFRLLVSHVRVPPALAAIAAGPERRVQAFLAAGHVCAVMGTGEYEAIASDHRMPIVATGFEPVDILQGVAMAVDQLERGESQVEIQYRRAVRPEGNPVARALMNEVFEVADVPWRGLGTVPRGGLRLREAWSAFDANALADADADADAAARTPTSASNPCRAGAVLRGEIRPLECPEFGRGCTPDRPLGAPMVSAEGACAAYFSYRVLEARVSEANP